MSLAKKLLAVSASLRRFSQQKEKTCEEWLKIVKLDGYALLKVPPKFKTFEFCIEAVKWNGWALEWVPLELRTPELCLEAVKKAGEALKDVPLELRTPDLCLIAVKKFGGALKDVPEQLRTFKLCELAVKSGRGSPFSYIPEEYREELKEIGLSSTNEEEEEENQKKKEQRKTSPENLQSEIKNSSLTQLMFDTYSLNFLHSEKTDDPQLVDFLWKEGLVKIKKKYSSFLLKELKEEAEVTEELETTLTTLDDYINLFLYPEEEFGFGGMAWAKIAYYTKKLSETNNPQEIMHIVDTINHLAHNSGNILNKWIENPEVLLDAKAHKESLRIMYPFCSSDVKSLLRDYFRNHLRSAMSRLRLVLAQRS